MITRIELNQVATYKNPVEINDLKKVNFFFGNNGSGKSTIARLFYNLSQNEVLSSPFNNSSIDGFNRNEEEIIVFDSDFVQNNFYNKTELSGIFSLDEKNEEIDENIKNEYITLANIEKSILDKDEEKQKIEKLKGQEYTNIIEDCWSYNKNFQENFNKINLGGRKDPFYEKLVEINKTEYSSKNINYISEKYKKYYLEELVKIENNISVNYFNEILHVEKELNNTLEEIIIGSNDVPIASIINGLNNSAWIQQGINFLDKEKEIQDCPFCQKQTIDKDLLEQFESYFDTTREEKIKNLKDLYLSYIKKVSSFDSNLKALTDLDLVKFDVLKIQNQLTNILNKNEKEIQAKIDNPNEKKRLETIELFKNKIEKINENITAHNKEIDNIEQNQQELTNEIWKYISHQVKDKINSFKISDNNSIEKLKRLKGEIDIFKNQKIESKDKIKEWQSQTINTQKAVDNINDLLLKNNFTGFKIEKKESENNIIKYYILREGETSENHIFKTLSEGEKNFIAFLYFYQMCLGTNDTQNSTKKKIIVIDDPVSSMDSQVLFFVSTLIRKLIAPRGGTGGGRIFKNENIEQAFILTHNSYFFKEVSFYQRLIYKDEVLFKKISKRDNITFIEDIGYSNINDYGLLWREIKTENSEKITISLLNNMRRIIESYSNFMGYINGSNLWSLLNNLDLDEESIEYLVCVSFLSNINDESHKVSINDEMYYNRLCDESRQIAMTSFKLFFEKLNGSSHYEMMMQIC
ncbi:AAA family ATPase [Chryseobacterium sp. LC2016-29]|uniref:AAA family ATPase n=1 Tax=Chryseobacterium sp. LC2016-29 TaxID=2897331 RepID=UPI001E4595A5|nr:AAA family ATPase [Chryseobacterium sp. LC2016-29]MCD0477559.1 AAA family ATPase [Chryseobacterium sp. LC2016-29]